jgi:dephospho-CoA kinase
VIAGLTGGIASGKSVVAGMFRELGAVIVESDRIGHDVILPGGPAYDDVVSAFGRSIIREDGTVDRDRLGAIVFHDAGKRQLLESMTHPHIIRVIRESVTSAFMSGNAPMVMVESALLYETGLYLGFESIVVVYVERETQKKRLMLRNGLDEAEAEARIASQMPLDEKAQRAQFVIDNSWDLERTRSQVRDVFACMTG